MSNSSRFDLQNLDMNKIVHGRKNHQHQYEGQPNAETVLTRFLTEWFPLDGFQTCKTANARHQALESGTN